jgi:hypothetical protein
MVNVSFNNKKRWANWATTGLLFASLLGSPISAFASTVLPAQVLPPTTTKACAPVTFSDIQAHVYGGSLDSFDVTISDPSYVAISTSVKGNAVGYNYITRWVNSDGSVKMHVDLQPIRMSSEVRFPVSAHLIWNT